MSRVSFVSQRFYLYNLLNRYFELKYVPKSTAQTNKNCNFIMKSLINSPLPKKKPTTITPTFQKSSKATGTVRTALKPTLACSRRHVSRKTENRKILQLAVLRICGPYLPPRTPEGGERRENLPTRAFCYSYFHRFYSVWMHFCCVFSPFWVFFSTVVRRVAQKTKPKPKNEVLSRECFFFLRVREEERRGKAVGKLREKKRNFENHNIAPRLEEKLARAIVRADEKRKIVHRA